MSQYGRRKSAYRNTVAADQQFKGKRFKVVGVVGSVNRDMFAIPKSRCVAV